VAAEAAASTRMARVEVDAGFGVAGFSSAGEGTHFVGGRGLVRTRRELACRLPWPDQNCPFRRRTDNGSPLR
jgi:hypothetical protein